MRRVGLVVLLVVAAITAAPSAAGVAPNKLIAPSVDPMSGTTTTVFTFSVRYRSASGYPALSVTASGDGFAVPLTLTSGTAVDGVWVGLSGLPVGSWTITFRAVAEQGENPTTSVGPVQVGPPPTPTPVRTPPPPTPPPPAATAPPATASSVAPSAAESATPPSPSPAVVGPGTGGDSSDGGSSPNGEGDWGGLLALVVGAAALGVAGFWLFRRQRKTAPGTRPPDGPLPSPRPAFASAAPASAGSPAKRPPADWELASALEEEPIGTVDSDAGDDRDTWTPATVTDARSPTRHAEPPNAPSKSVAEMHGWRGDASRRTLLRRIGLSEDES